MELKFTSREGNKAEIEFAGEDATLLNLLKQALLDRDDVASASFLSGHPTLDEPRLSIEVTEGGDPRDAVAAASVDLQERLGALRDQLAPDED